MNIEYEFELLIRLEIITLSSTSDLKWELPFL